MIRKSSGMVSAMLFALVKYWVNRPLFSSRICGGLKKFVESYVFVWAFGLVAVIMSVERSWQRI